MRIFKTFLAMILAASFLVACGDGGGSDSGTTSETGGSTANLLAAYQAITPSTSLAQVNALVGYAPNGGSSGYSDGSTSYMWWSEKGTATLALLSVHFRADGSVELKIINGPSIGLFSQSY